MTGIIGKHFESARIQPQDQFIDQRAAPGCVPAFKHNDRRDLPFMQLAMQLSQLISQQFHSRLIIGFVQFLAEIYLFKHGPPPSERFLYAVRCILRQSMIK